MKGIFWIIVAAALIVAAPQYAIAWLVMTGVVAGFNLLIKLHDKYMI